MSAPGPAAQTVSDIIEASRYLVLATADAAGRPWSSPLYFAHIGFSEFFWVSSPDVTHSRNIAVRPEVGIVIFDSQVPIGAGQGVYMSAVAELVESRLIWGTVAGREMPLVVRVVTGGGGCPLVVAVCPPVQACPWEGGRGLPADAGGPWAANPFESLAPGP